MPGRKEFTPEEIAAARAAVAERLTAFRNLRWAIDDDARDGGSTAPRALAALQAKLFNDLLLALDRRFVHRVRALGGKDGNPLNEVELICEALLSHGGVLQDSTVIRYVPERSVLKLKVGDPIALSADDFELLTAAFFDELERRFRPAAG